MRGRGMRKRERGNPCNQSGITALQGGLVSFAVHMNRILFVAVPALLLPGISSALLAQTATKPAPARTAMEARFEKALKQFPDADLNKDGMLTMEEAFQYMAAHPEVRQTLAGGSKTKAKGPSTSKPGALSTSESKGLPPGPRVFVCAHSFMIYTGQMLPGMTEASGVAYRDAGRQMIGGSRVLQHWEVPDDKNLAKQVLRDGAVDVLTVSPHMLLPDEGIDNFTKLGMEKNPKLRVLVQASWPARDGNAGEFHNEMRNESTVESLRKLQDMHETNWVAALEKQVKSLNEGLGKETVHIIPVSRAVFALREKIVQGVVPGLTKQTDLFRDDLGHPNPPMAVLVTYCHFAAIHQKSPEGLPVPDAIKDLPRAAELNALMQKIAWEAVSTYPMSGVKAETGDKPERS
jgi:hypothetical protein